MVVVTEIVAIRNNIAGRAAAAGGRQRSIPGDAGCAHAVAVCVM